MARKFFSGLLIALSAILLVLSFVGIGAIWFYNGRLTREVTSRLTDIDNQMAEAQTTLQSSEKELQRALRIVDAAQASLDKLKKQTNTAGNLLDTIKSTLDDQLLPELRTTRERINTARTTLESLRSILASVGRFAPGLDFKAPDKVLTDLIASTKSLDTDIANAEGLATQASTFASDTSYLFGGDLTETRTSLQTFLTSIQDYEKKIAGWREQDKRILEGAPKWINEASIGLTIFLTWFALSQFGLLLHGLSLQAGGAPLAILRRERESDPLLQNERDLELEE